MIGAAIDDVRTNEEVWQDLQDLDLDPIKIKLMDPDEGEGWTLEWADEVEKWYKRFLLLTFKYPERPIVPPKVIDTFWHQHVLDTRKYSDDCERIFGYFLHHFPYFGMRGEEDAANLENSFQETLTLFEKEFGEALSSLGTSGVKCDSCGKGSCGHSGSWCGKCKGYAPNPMKPEVRPRLIR